jgi:hypothetical protein
MKPEYYSSSFILDNETVITQQLIMYGVFSLN